ncbi:MAG TPA: T9SS type A sorting domain-containing protein, partial [Saprospiraceae bacterium]|nr:T9SS type A sorting domain-containing protein [Saprospiraceae bacterium]
QGAIDVSWLVKEAFPGGANATIEAQWYPSNGDQLPGFDSSKCMVVRYKATGWDFSGAQAGPATGTTAKTKNRSGMTAFGYYTVLSTATPTLQNSITTVNTNNSIRQNTSGAQILVYPTIVQRSVNISVSKNAEDIETMNVTIMNAAGKTVLRKEKINLQSQQVLLPQLSPGVYLVVIEYGSNSYNQKIIVSE